MTRLPDRVNRAMQLRTAAFVREMLPFQKPDGQWPDKKIPRHFLPRRLTGWCRRRACPRATWCVRRRERSKEVRPSNPASEPDGPWSGCDPIGVNRFSRSPGPRSPGKRMLALQRSARAPRPMKLPEGTNAVPPLSRSICRSWLRDGHRHHRSVEGMPEVLNLARSEQSSCPRCVG